MWNFASNALAGTLKSRNGSLPLNSPDLECSDDEASSCTSKDEGTMDCPICCESFNIVENIPYVLWCGHTLCKNCVMGLQWAVVKFPNLPVQLPLFIACPWCHLLSFRVVYKGILKFPRKNFFLLWMIESMNGERVPSSCISDFTHRQPVQIQQLPRDISNTNSDDFSAVTSNWNAQRIWLSVRKSLVFIAHLTAKFPLVVVFLLVVVYAIPASAVILALYILVTILLALPSMFILYFAYPSLDWLVREILT